MIVEEGGNHSFEGIERHFETIREFFAVGDYFKHTSSVIGFGVDNRELAERVGDLYYDDLAYFLESLSRKLATDAMFDRKRGRKRLADALDNSANLIGKSIESMNEAWDICEVPTIKWMIQNGFNRPKHLRNLKKLPDDIKAWYFGIPITMSNELYNEILEYSEKRWKELTNCDGPSLIGTRADLYRFIDGVIREYEEKYPEYADEISAVMHKKYEG